MSFYDDLGAQLKQAELLLEAEEAQAQATPSRTRTRRPRLSRPVLLGSFAAVLAAIVFVAISSDTRTPVAQAGLAILDAEAIAATDVPLTGLERELANARTAHPFDTPNGTGYAFLSRGRDGVKVCVLVPSGERGVGPASDCKPRKEAEARGVAIALVPEEPLRSLDVVVLPVGVATALYTPDDGGPPVVIPSVNGVATFQAPAKGELSWAAEGGHQTREVSRAFPASKLRFTCRDRTVIYTDQTMITRRNEPCADHERLRELMGIPTYEPETDAKPENRSRFVDRATGQPLTPAPTTP